MTTAVLTDYSQMLSRLPAGSEIALPEQTFDDYEEILESVGEASDLRISFNGEKIKIITLLTQHEKYVRFIERLVDNLSMRKRIKILSFGSATMKSSRHECGSEPDCSFYVQNADVIGSLRSLDFSRDIPPDIVVEVDIYHAPTGKSEIYAKLGVSEYWLFDGEEMKIYELENERYEAVETSPALPILTGEILTRHLALLKTNDQYEALLAFENWLDEQTNEN